MTQCVKVRDVEPVVNQADVLDRSSIEGLCGVDLVLVLQTLAGNQHVSVHRAVDLIGCFARLEHPGARHHRAGLHQTRRLDPFLGCDEVERA